jgi:N-acetylmuramoyl-L-alanine amidase
MRIYLSPSNQPHNSYVLGGTQEKAQMEGVAARIKAILDTEYVCEAAMATLSLVGLSERAKEAKDAGCNVYLAIHSNSGDGKATGAMAFYHPDQPQGKVLATNIVKELGAVCPVKSTRSSPVQDGMAQFGGAGMGEVRDPASLGLIAVLAETDFHDTPVTALWIVNNKDTIARAYVHALADTFNIARKPKLSVALQSCVDKGIINPSGDLKRMVDIDTLAWAIQKLLIWLGKA